MLVSVRPSVSATTVWNNYLGMYVGIGNAGENTTLLPDANNTFKAPAWGNYFKILWKF